MQGVRGMDAKERRFRLVLALLLATVFGLRRPGGLLPPPAAAVFGPLAAHSINFTLNGQVWVCCRYCRWYRRDPARVDAWLAATIVRLRRLDWLGGGAVHRLARFGPRARAGGARTSTSGSCSRPGRPRGARTNLLLLRLRADAFVRAIPLDLYAYDGVAALDRFRQDEPLLVVLDRDGDPAAALPPRAT